MGQTKVTSGWESAHALSVEQAADYLGISVSFLNKQRCKGGGPEFFKLGSRILYAPHDLDIWREQHRRRSTADRGEAA